MNEKPQRILLDISWEALLKIVALAVGLWAIVLLKEELIMLFVVFIFVAAVNPSITRLQKYMSRFLAVFFYYLLFFFILSLLSYFFLPRLVTQVNGLAQATPSIIEKSRPYLESFQSDRYQALIDQGVNAVGSGMKNFSDNLFSTTVNFFGGMAIVITGIVLSFYLLLEEKNAREFFNQLLPQHRFEAVYTTVNKIADRMGNWVRGQVALMVIIGISDLIAYLIIGVASPLPLAIWAGLCEVIPYIGPALGVIPAIVVALATGSIWQAILVFLVAFLVIQQIEAHLVVPKVVGKAVGLSPVLVILSILVGVKLFGLIGALVAVPAAAIISVVVGEWPSLRKLWEG